MKIKIKTAKGDGTAIGTVLRQLTLNGSKSWRPIAYKLSCNNNLLQASDLILEDMIEFTSALSSLNFKVNSPVPSPLVKTYRIKKGQFTSDSLTDPDITVSPKIPLLTSLSTKDIDLEVIYLYSSGNRSSDQNLETLRDSAIFTREYNVISSRHSTINDFTFDIIERGLDEEELTLILESPVNEEERILQESIRTLVGYLKNISTSVESS